MMRQDYTLTLLEDLKNQTYKPTQVVIVDATPPEQRDESLYDTTKYPFELIVKWQIIKGGNKFLTIKRITPPGTLMNHMNDVKIVQHCDLYDDRDIIGEPQMYQQPNMNDNALNSGNNITFAPVIKINTKDVLDECEENHKEPIVIDDHSPDENISFTEIKPEEHKSDKTETPLDFSKLLIVKKP